LHFDVLFNSFFEYTIGGLAFGAIYALVALGYTMVYGVLQLINFAHSEVFMYGTFAVAWVGVLLHGTEQTNVSLGGGLGLLLVSLVAAMLVSGGIALLLERVAYRPLIKANAPKLIALISAIGASFALAEAMGLRDRLVDAAPGALLAVVVGGVVGTLLVAEYVRERRQRAGASGSTGTAVDVRRGPAVICSILVAYVVCSVLGLTGWLDDQANLREKLQPYVRKARDLYSNPVTYNKHEVFSIGDLTLYDIDLLVICAALLMMVALDYFVRRTKFGRGIRAVAQDPESAALMGVNSTRVVQVTFLIGGLMAGAAATLYMLKIGSTRQSAGFILGVKAFTAAVLGGIGNLRGALLGGLLLGVLENYGSALFGSNWKDVTAFVILVLILLVRPSGILGEALGKARA
jgi:branched-subunit amino acid ABC-type transport system permease component